ncbi:hypothetical protein CRG98_012610 [Punica granatum]|uniref:Uncharacterized protein n=1 Tax=Punica granatum TaxID=22663 RepID=A0A2I0KEQ8_PUNGR|nr:hypothetical protein CRG98_012610 [Punica granatum]
MDGQAAGHGRAQGSAGVHAGGQGCALEHGRRVGRLVYARADGRAHGAPSMRLNVRACVWRTFEHADLSRDVDHRFLTYVLSVFGLVFGLFGLIIGCCGLEELRAFY